MPEPESRETLEVIPRYLSLCIENGDSRFYFSPTSEIMGNALRRSPRILNRILKGTAGYKKRQMELYQEGASYEPVFPWPDELLETEPEVIPVLVRDGIKERDRTFILFDAEPYESVRNLTIKGNVLTAEVKAKRSQDENRPRYHKCQLRSAFTDFDGNPDLTVVSCNCDDYVHDMEKGGKNIQTFFQCTHNASMRSEFEERVYLQPQSKKAMTVKGNSPKRPVFSPFPFTPNWTYNRGVYQPKNKHLAALEGDVLVTYYVIREDDDNLFGIGRRLLGIEDCYSPTLLEGIRAGSVTRKVIGQRRKKAPMSSTRLREEEYLACELDKEIRAWGYEYDGMCLELGSVARRYSNDDNGNAVNVVFSANRPPFYTTREPIPGNRPRPSDEYSGEMNPFKLVGRRNLTAFDDATMMDTKLNVGLPTVLRLPEADRGYSMDGVSNRMRRYFRTALRKAHGGEVTGKEKLERVHFC
jgi:hypothetical protein